ncbi:uncharacterized protein LACBIDRAFT_333432 [Laccaria bicolor S238N-H82]|uniref:Predicted protein n=1 Tax=Laccaria bicolor (strain S238N-H82 / ATCC MYA-4686) TaxID=486041 RepID=B0DVW3_LACBS|nr:uncharacterized protein LACBIDRAFT_333432 [Laccaria bicolor S238N-H82]EDR01203.1 predicted protein [Laccaria bicolor S238N-H82]|eukprot:XP_001888079.1 predicted protein [Laccaria bicolor S238N-H82]
MSNFNLPREKRLKGKFKALLDRFTGADRLHDEHPSGSRSTFTRAPEVTGERSTSLGVRNVVMRDSNFYVAQKIDVHEHGGQDDMASGTHHDIQAPQPRIHKKSRPGDLPHAKYEHMCKEPLRGFHAPKERKNCCGRGGLGWMGLDGVGLVGDDRGQKICADAVFALGVLVKLQALCRVWARNEPGSSLNFTQAIIDGPTTGVSRQSYYYKHLTLGTEAGRSTEETSVYPFRSLERHDGVLPRISRKSTIRQLDFANKRIGDVNAVVSTTNGGGVFVVGLRYVPLMFATFEAHDV